MNCRIVDDSLLRAWPLPRPAEDDDKEGRGDALVLGGSRETPGAILLAAIATLRVGAGRICVGTASSVAAGLALNLPEARVVALPESEHGALSCDGIEALAEVLERCRVVLLGPGCMDDAGTLVFASQLLARTSKKTQVILDASAMAAAKNAGWAAPAVLTPHAGEMAHLFGVSKAEVRSRPADFALQAAKRWHCVVTLKGSTTFIATERGELWRHDGGDVGLATSGSGDVLAGLITGLVARGASAAQAAVWGVSLHARAGAALAARIGPLGYLASELSAEVPRLMEAVKE